MKTKERKKKAKRKKRRRTNRKKERERERERCYALVTNYNLKSSTVAKRILLLFYAHDAISSIVSGLVLQAI